MTEKTSVEHLADKVQAQREDDEITRAEMAAILDADRTSYTIRLEERLKATTRANYIRFLALYVGIILVFGLLAYRTEVNASALAHGFYDACVTRQSRQIQANVGRETLVQLAANGPTAPPDEAAKAALIKQLRDALLLPVEDCGTAP